MSTAGQVVDRVLRDWLYGPDDQPIVCTLSGDIDNDDLSLVYADAMLAPEEEDLLAPGTVIEIDSEQMRVGAVDESANTLSSLSRAANGTTAASHSGGALITVSPTWARKTVFDAVADAVEQLWPELYAVGETAPLALSSSTYTEVPATVMDAMFLWARSTGATDWEQVTSIRFLDHFPPSSTGKAIYAGFDGSGYLVHKKQLVRPPAEATDLVATSLLEDQWEQLVAVSAVAYLVSGKDLAAATQSQLTEQLQAQGFPIGSGQRIREGLVRYQSFLLDKHKRALRSRNPVTVVVNEVV